MALINCKECNKEISSEAASCPHCGYKKGKDSQTLSWLIGWVLIIVIALYMLGKCAQNPSITNPADTSTQQSNTDDLPEPVDNRWVYETYTDTASGKETKVAHVMSNNLTHLEFPYQGGTHAFLSLAKHPRFGKSASVQVNKGQLHCQYNNCYISIRFDDGPVKKYNVSPPSDRSNETYFIEKHAEITKHLNTAKKAFVELTFFRQGSFTFEFNVSELNLDQLN